MCVRLATAALNTEPIELGHPGTVSLQAMMQTSVDFLKCRLGHCR
jgi:hypothetical protein